MLPKGILFDLDDTIIAFDEVANPTWKCVCADYAKEPNVVDSDLLYNTINEVRKWYWADKKRHKVGRRDLDKTRRKIVSLAFERLQIDNVNLAYDIADTYSVKREEKIQFSLRANSDMANLKRQYISELWPIWTSTRNQFGQ